MQLSNIKNNLIIFFSILISILISTLLWDKIYLPLNNNNVVRGPLTEVGYNHFSDTIRYVVFISLPLFTFLLLEIFLKKKNINIVELLFEKEEAIKTNQPNLTILSIIFVIFIILEFFSQNLFITKLDFLHDGEFLTPAQNYLLTKKIWLSSYSMHGSSDILYPLTMWKILEVESIGAARISTSFLFLFLKLLIILFSYQLTKITNLSNESKILFFTIFTSILLSMCRIDVIDNSYFNYRDIYVILFLILFVELFIYSKLKYFITISICCISTISILLHIDIGFYLNFLLIFYSLYLISIKKYNELLLIFLSVIIFWYIAIYLIGFDEFKAFLDHAKTQYLSADSIHGSKYPVPFFSIGEVDDGTRATRGLLLQIIAGLFVISYIISDKSKIFNTKKIFFVFLFLLSFVMYKNALGRSDADHIRMSADFPILIICFFVLNYLFNFIENKFETKNLLKKTYLISSAIFLVFFYFINQDNYRIDNIKNFEKNFTNFTQLEDRHFLDRKTIKVVDYYNQITKKDKCVQIFTYDLAFPYLLKKPSCTKYYASWLASPISKQEDYIKKLKATQPKYILYDSFHFIESLELSERLELVNSYILSEYKEHSQLDGYIFLEKK